MLAVFASITASPWAWRSVAKLTAIDRHDPAMLAELQSAGWLEPWEIAEDRVKDRPLRVKRPTPMEVARAEKYRCPVGPCVTLSQRAADAMLVEIVELEVTGRPRWGKTPDPDPDAKLGERRVASPLPGWKDLPEPPTSYVNDQHDGQMTLIRDQADPRPGPEETAIEREELAMRTDEVERYDAERDERTIEKVTTRLEMLGVGGAAGSGDGLKGGLAGKGPSTIRVDTRIKGKKGRRA